MWRHGWEWAVRSPAPSVVNCTGLLRSMMVGMDLVGTTERLNADMAWLNARARLGLQIGPHAAGSNRLAASLVRLGDRAVEVTCTGGKLGRADCKMVAAPPAAGARVEVAVALGKLPPPPTEEPSARPDLALALAQSAHNLSADAARRLVRAQALDVWMHRCAAERNRAVRRYS